MNSFVSVDRLKISYGQKTIIDSLDLDIERGEFIVLLGPSGCGKSTLLNAIAGLNDISGGAIHIAGKDVTRAEPKDRGIGMVFQSYALYPRMSVKRNLSFGLRVAGLPKEEIEKRVDRAASMLHLQPLLDRKPAELSGGQRQRVAIGRALVRDVDVFLFDEPLSNLDANLRSKLRVEIKKLHQTLGNTMIYVTHDQVEALTLADRIVILKDGVVQQFATPSEIYHRPINKFVAGFIGAPAMNFVDGTIAVSGNVAGFVSDTLTLDLSTYPFLHPPKPGPAAVGVRPEHLMLTNRAGKSLLKGDVTVLEPMGAETVIWFESGSHTHSLRQMGDPTVRPGDVIHVSVDPSKISLFSPDGTRL